MRNIVNRILSVFKKKSRKELSFNDVYRVCRFASGELGNYCKVEGIRK